VSPAISLDSFHFGSTNTAIDSGDEEEIEPLITRMEKLEIEVAPYFEHLGQTSGHRLAEKVLKLREETQGQPNIVEMPPSTFSRFDPVSQSLLKSVWTKLTQSGSGNCKIIFHSR
jgi:hypothetical protein